MSVASAIALVSAVLLAIVGFGTSMHENLFKRYKRWAWGVIASLLVVSTAATIVQSWQSERELDQARHEVLDTIIGGDSFCYLELGGMVTPAGIPNITVIHSGKYPIYDAQVRIVPLTDPSRDPNARTVDRPFGNDLFFQIGSLSPNTATILPANQKIVGDSLKWNAFFFARNRSWDQLLRLRRVNGQWLMATKIISKKDERQLYYQVDSGYPTPIDWE